MIVSADLDQKRPNAYPVDFGSGCRLYPPVSCIGQDRAGSGHRWPKTKERTAPWWRCRQHPTPRIQTMGRSVGSSQCTLYAPEANRISINGLFYGMRAC